MRTTHLWLPLAAALSLGCKTREPPPEGAASSAPSAASSSGSAATAPRGADAEAAPGADGGETDGRSGLRRTGRWGDVRIEPRTSRQRLAPACEIEVTSPKVSGLPESASRALQAGVRAELDALQRALFADAPCAGATEQLPHGFEAGYELGGERNGLVGVELQATAFTGGAHSNALLRCVVLDLAEGRVLRLEPLLTSAGRARMSEMATRRLAQEHGVTRLSEAGFFVDELRIQNPGSLCLTDDGIRVVFQQYEVAPFALGFPAVTLKLAEVVGAFGPGAPPGLVRSPGGQTP